MLLSWRGGFGLLASSFCILPSPGRWLQEQRQVPPLFYRVLGYVSLLRAEAAGLGQAGGGPGRCGGGAPGSSPLLGQQAAFTPGLRGSAESGPGAPLDGGAWVFGHDINAPAQPAIGPIINIAAGPAAHGPLVPKDLGM